VVAGADGDVVGDGLHEVPDVAALLEDDGGPGEARGGCGGLLFEAGGYSVDHRALAGGDGVAGAVGEAMGRDGCEVAVLDDGCRRAVPIGGERATIGCEDDDANLIGEGSGLFELLELAIVDGAGDGHRQDLLAGLCEARGTRQ